MFFQICLNPHRFHNCLKKNHFCAQIYKFYFFFIFEVGEGIVKAHLSSLPPLKSHLCFGEQKSNYFLCKRSQTHKVDCCMKEEASQSQVSFQGYLFIKSKLLSICSENKCFLSFFFHKIKVLL